MRQQCTLTGQLRAIISTGSTTAGSNSAHCTATYHTQSAANCTAAAFTSRLGSTGPFGVEIAVCFATAAAALGLLGSRSIHLCSTITACTARGVHRLKSTDRQKHRKRQIKRQQIKRQTRGQEQTRCESQNENQMDRQTISCHCDPCKAHSLSADLSCAMRLYPTQGFHRTFNSGI